MGDIVVGVDDSESAAVALRWAMREALLSSASVVAVMGWGYFNQHHPDGAQFVPGYDSQAASASLSVYVANALGAELADQVKQVAIDDDPASALLNAAHGAQLLVVGARLLGGFRSLLLGSVSRTCLHCAPCPIAVVRLDSQSSTTAEAPVVVGLDGSKYSTLALQWAADEAVRRGSRLIAVRAWTLPFAFGTPPATPVDPAVFVESSEAELDNQLRSADLSALAHSVERLVIHCSPAATLVDLSDEAGLVVVGSRGMDPWRGVALGSVSAQVAEHSHCPVEVVPR